IKSRLRRKFELFKVSAGNQNIKLYFELKNFIKFDANDFFIKINNEKKHCKVKKKSNNYIEIDVNSEHILNKDLSFSFFYKNKKLYFKIKNFIKLNENDFYIKIKNEKKHCKVKKKSNNYIEIDVNSEHILNKDLSFSFFYKNKKLWTTSEKNLNHILEVNNNI